MLYKDIYFYIYPFTLNKILFTIGVKRRQEYIMGSYSSTQIGNIVIDTAKNSLPFSGFLFCYEDKRRIYVSEDSEYNYFLTRKLQTILPRLELEGYTLKNAKKILSYDLRENYCDMTYKDVIQRLTTIDFINTKSYTEIENLLFGDKGLYYGGNPLALLRIIVEILKGQDIEIYLDYTDLRRGGWLEKKFLPNIESEFLILTEGKTDTEILKLSLQKIYPYIAPYFSFANMEESPFGGTTNLVKFLKGLNSIDYENNVIAIFDNDTAGNAAILEVPQHMNTNIKVMSLPKHKKFSKFNTIGVSDKMVKKNINGSGVAIECFLDIPEDAFIRWVSYDEKLKKYQGCFDTNSKKKYYNKFISEIKNIETEYDYSMLTFLWDEIIKTAVQMSEKSLSSLYHTRY